MSSSDFLSWDDECLDLSILLGEYTDYENNESISNEQQLETEKVMYVCPSCSKEMKSISGFRGHVTKKHGLNHLKASEHRKIQPKMINNTDPNSAAEPQLPSKLKGSSKSAWIPNHIYIDIFENSFHMTNQEIQNSPIHNLFGRSTVSEIADFCDTNMEFMLKTKILFEKLALVPVNIVLSEDREQLFRKLHELRLSKDLTEIEKLLRSAKCPYFDDIRGYLQIFMLEMTNSLLTSLSKNMEKMSKEDTKLLSDNDQKILFYISGYIIHALKAKYNRIHNQQTRSLKLNVIERLTSDQSSEKFIEMYASFFDRKNKGGLQRPCDEFYLLTRSMENAFRKISPNESIPKSISKCAIAEYIMEDYMVKHYIETLFPTTDSEMIENGNEQSQCYLEDTVSLFMTIRGFAVARVERNKLALRNKIRQSSAIKSGNSLRGVLKEKCLHTGTQN